MELTEKEHYRKDLIKGHYSIETELQVKNLCKKGPIPGLEIQLPHL